MNQIIEPKEPIHGPIEMQSGHQEISMDARNNEYDALNQGQQPYFRSGSHLQSSQTNLMSKRLLKGKLQQPAPDTDSLIPLTGSSQLGQAYNVHGQNR